MDVVAFSKQCVKSLLKHLHLDLTQNLKYDRYTELIIKNEVHSQSVCIDVGAHKGEILDLIIKKSPNKKHFAFEPIPLFYNGLKEKYGDSIQVFPYALSDIEGSSTFQFVKNAPAYSGIKQRDYKVKNPEIEKINVDLKKLDDVIPENQHIDLIKIDVEGAEFQVLKGGVRTIQKSKPLIIFECGLGASEFYGTSPEELYTFIEEELGLKLSTLVNFIHKKPQLQKEEFIKHYKDGSEYYFIMHP